MAWSITLDFQDGGGAREIKDIVLVNTIRRKKRLWNDLRPTIDTCVFEIVYDSTIWNLLLTETDDILVEITKDVSEYFGGVVYSNFTVLASATAEHLRLELSVLLAGTGLLEPRADRPHR